MACAQKDLEEPSKCFQECLQWPYKRSQSTIHPVTVDFMPPEAIQEIPEYNIPLGVHTVNQESPKPLCYVMTDPKTGKQVALSEVQRRQEHIRNLSLTRIPADLHLLVEQCLDDNPGRRPPISDVSERMTRMREVENERCPHINMDPISWYIDYTTTKLVRQNVYAFQCL